MCFSMYTPQTIDAVMAPRSLAPQTSSKLKSESKTKVLWCLFQDVITGNVYKLKVVGGSECWIGFFVRFVSFLLILKTPGIYLC